MILSDVYLLINPKINIKLNPCILLSSGAVHVIIISCEKGWEKQYKDRKSCEALYYCMYELSQPIKFQDY